MADDFILNWSATDNNTGLTITGTGPMFDFFSIMPTELGLTGFVTINFSVTTGCGVATQTHIAPYQICNTPGQHRQISISPNPTIYQVAVSILQNQTQDFITTDPNGIRIRIYPTNGGVNTVLDSYLYSNGQYFNVSSLPTGMYQVRATAADLPPIHANLSIIR